MTQINTKENPFFISVLSLKILTMDFKISVIYDKNKISKGE